MADKDDLGGLLGEGELTLAQHLSDLVEDCGLKRLLNFSDRIGLLGVSRPKIVDCENWVALRGGVADPIVLGGAVWVAWKAEPVALGFVSLGLRLSALPDLQSCKALHGEAPVLPSIFLVEPLG